MARFKIFLMLSLAESISFCMWFRASFVYMTAAA